MEVLLGLLFVLAVVTVVGHGIWVLLAGLSRALAGDAEHDVPPRVRTFVPCARCGTKLTPWNLTCPDCGLARQDPADAELGELERTAWQVRRLHQRGDLDDRAVECLKRCLEARRRSLLDARAVPVAEEVVETRPATGVLEALPAQEEPILEALPAEGLSGGRASRPPSVPAGETPAPQQHPPTDSHHPVPVPLPRAPRRSLGDMLAGFMEERNILWGELVGGLLIVGCSIALVITLWHSLEELPYFPFLLFAGITAALFGAGQYTLHHWKLESTSRGLLVIALLLVPLNLLVLADPTVGPPGGWLGPALKAGALLLFAGMIRTSGRDLIGTGVLPGPVDRRWLLVLAVLGAAGSQLLVPPRLDDLRPGGLLLLGCLPVACHVLAVGLVVAGLVRAGRREGSGRLTARQANSLFVFLGLATFALLVSLGFLLSRGEELAPALHRLAVPFAASGVPILAAGLLVQRRLGGEGTDGLRAAGTGVALGGLAVMLAGAAFAWPAPLPLLAVCALDGVTLTAIAFGCRTPRVHAAALPCLAAAALVAFHLVAGNLPAPAGADPGRWLVQQVTSSAGGVVLAAFALLLAAAAEGLVRIGRREDGAAYAVGGAGAALFGLQLVTLHGLERPGVAAVVYGLCALAMLLANFRWQRAWLPRVGLGLLAGSGLWALWAVAPGNLPVWGLVLALEALALALAAAGLSWKVGSAAWGQLRAACHDLAIGTGLLAVGLAVFSPGFPVQLSHTGTAAALALAAFLLAWAWRSPAWFTVSQAALSCAVVFGVTAWLEGRPWTGIDPRSLQAYGIGLACLGLLWVVARTGLSANERLRDLWHPAWPSLDWVVLGMLVIGQFALALAGVWPEVVGELAPVGMNGWVWPARLAHAYGPGAWVLLGVLAVVLLAALRERGRATVIVGLTVLAVTVPVLAAGRSAPELAAASALRWGLALCFLACSALVWLRGPLARAAGAAGVTFAPGSPDVWVRGLLMVVAGAVLALTAALAALGFAHLTPSGPLAGSVFARMGWTLSAVVPLVVLAAGLVGHALRERSAGYAFAAGLVAGLALVGGYALGVVTGGGNIGEVELVRMLQLGSAGAAVWALAWLLARRRVCAWRELPSPDFIPPATARPLMLLQLGLAVVGNVCLLATAVLVRGNLLLRPDVWSAEAGTPLGWLALLAVLVALVAWRRQRELPLVSATLFLTGAGLPVLLGCTVGRLLPGAGYRALLLATAGYGLLWSLIRVHRDVVRRQDLSELIAVLYGASLFVVANAVVGRGDYLWPAAALVVMSLTAVLLAGSRCSAAWQVAGGVFVNLAVSLVAWHFLQGLPPAGRVVPLVLANVSAGAAVVLLWRLAQDRLPSWPGLGSLLSLESILVLAANSLLLLAPLGVLFFFPDTPLAAEFAPLGEGGGWLALLLALTAALACLGRTAPRARLHVLGVGGMSAGVLAACVARAWDAVGLWLSYHVVMIAWGLLGLLTLAAGSVAFSFRVSGLTAADDRRAGRFAALFPADLVPRWVEAVGLGLVLLALRGGWEDWLRPWSSAAAVLVVSMMAAALALWLRRGLYAYASGLLLNLIAVLFWSRWGPDTVTSLLLVNALCLAVASTLWSGVELALRTGDLAPRWRSLPFAHFAVNLGLGLLVVVVGMALAGDFTGGETGREFGLAWGAVAALLPAFGVCLWDRRARFPLPGLYTLGLAALGLVLHGFDPTPAGLGRNAGLALALYAVGTTALYRMLGGNAKPQAATWLLPAQTVLVCVVVALSVWTSLGFAYIASRLAGPLAVLLLAVGGVLLAGGAPARWAAWLRPGALVLGAVAGGEVAGAFPDPAGIAPWLDRSVLLVVALAAMTVLYGSALPRWLSRRPEWAGWCGSLGPVLGGLGSLALLALLGQEFQFYNPATRHTPLAVPGVLAVVAAVVTLMASGVRFAVVPGRDPLGLSERGRTLYVYAVEILLVLLFVHLRLNVPELFRGWAVRYWTLIVMGIAFLGVGLSEYFQRRKLGVLAEPLQRTALLLPLLPVLAFWLRPPAVLLDAGGGHAGVPYHLDRYALVWFLVCGLYALMALSRRSFRWALLAALAGNFGLWALLAHHGVAFLTHPQFWLIPLALVVLVSEHLNRDRLPAELSSALRYLGVCMVYVSSTADLFIAGLGNSVWLPVLLAVLAVLGVLAGILLRVRAFLFLGVSFLILDVFSQIWYAAVDRYHTWVWWASGIVLGAAILALFAFFEKRRDDVLRLFEEIRQWD